MDTVRNEIKQNDVVEELPQKKRGRQTKAVSDKNKKPAASAKEHKASADKEVKLSEKKRIVAQKKAQDIEKKTEKAADAVPTDRSSKAKRKNSESRVVEVSNKTPQVMRLVERGNDMVNPTILAGKSSIPRKLRGMEPLTKIMKREAQELFGTNDEEETFNLTALVIDENAAEILRRFNACDCSICVEQLSRLTSELVPARFAKLTRRAVERKCEEVEQLKAPLRRSVTSQMIRLVIANKKRSYHD